MPCRPAHHLAAAPANQLHAQTWSQSIPLHCHHHHARCAVVVSAFAADSPLLSFSLSPPPLSMCVCVCHSRHAGGWQRFSKQKKYSVGGFYFNSPETIRTLVMKANLRIVKESTVDASNVYVHVHVCYHCKCTLILAGITTEIFYSW